MVQELSKTVTYPDSDGQPMADNTKQFRWIVTIQENLERLYADQSDVFIALEQAVDNVTDRNRQLEAKLRELGIDPDPVRSSPVEFTSMQESPVL